MEFDMVSMKQRAKALMSSTSPNPKALGVIFSVLILAYYIAFFYTCGTANFFVLLIAELVYFNFRNSCKWYAMKISREEKTGFSDILSAFKHRPIKIILLSILRVFLYAVGFCVFYIGIVFPLYWFRFAGHILRDENINVFKAMRKSMKMLKGHYVELIKLDISNLGWHLLLYFSFGIAGFYVKPYTAIVYAEFYDYIKAQNELFS